MSQQRLTAFGTDKRRASSGSASLLRQGRRGGGQGRIEEGWVSIANIPDISQRDDEDISS